MINKPIDIKLKNLFEKVELSLDRAELAELPVYFGGPVQTERGFVLHEKLGDDGSAYSSTMSVPGGLEMTTSKDVLEALSSGAGPKKMLVTLGYSGWQAGQLEDELGRNGWLTVDADPAIIFDTPDRAALRPCAVAAGLRPAHALAGGGARMNAAPAGARSRSWLSTSASAASAWPAATPCCARPRR